MKSTIKLLTLAALVAAPLVWAGGHDEVSAKDRAAIVELLRAHDQYLSASDLDHFFALMADDYVELPAGLPTLANRDAARKSLGDFLASYQLAIHSDIRALGAAGDWAWVRTETDQKRTKKDGGEVMKLHGKSLFILHRQPGGGWKISTSMWSNDGPPQPVK